MVYYGKSVAGIFLGTYGILYPWERLTYRVVKYDHYDIAAVAESLYCLQHTLQYGSRKYGIVVGVFNNDDVIPLFPDLPTVWFLITYSMQQYVPIPQYAYCKWSKDSGKVW